MTIQKLIDKYTKLYREGYETIIITQVINDLMQIRRKTILQKARRNKEAL